MSFWCVDDPRCPVRWWPAEQVVAIHDALEELLDCIRRAHPEILKDHDRWDDIVEDRAETPGNLDEDEDDC